MLSLSIFQYSIWRWRRRFQLSLVSQIWGSFLLNQEKKRQKLFLSLLSEEKERNPETNTIELEFTPEPERETGVALFLICECPHSSASPICSMNIYQIRTKNSGSVSPSVQTFSGLIPVSGEGPWLEATASAYLGPRIRPSSLNGVFRS